MSQMSNEHEKMVSKNGDYKTIFVEHASFDERVLFLILNRPAARNSISTEMIDEVSSFLQKCEEDKMVNLIILKGEGPVFSAGGDLKEMQKLSEGKLDENRENAYKLASFFRKLFLFSKPIIGFISGDAYGGGVGLVSICDYVIAKESATFSLSESRLGLAPFVISPYLHLKCGYKDPSRCSRYIFTGENFSVDEAIQIGLVQEKVLDEDSLERRVVHISKEFLEGKSWAQNEFKKWWNGMRLHSLTSFAEYSMEKSAEQLALLRNHPKTKELLKEKWSK